MTCAYKDTFVNDRDIFFDGEPSYASKEQITKLLKSHENDYLTFVSCTDNPREVEWVKGLDRCIANCAEIDDFETEKREV